jgi:hypothetical protein
MRTLSSSMATAVAAPVTRPGVLVSIAFSTTQRYSSAGTISWNGFTWTTANVKLENLAVDALQLSGTLVIGNHDDAIGALILAQGIQDKAITLYGIDATATATADVVWLATAVGASCELNEFEARIGLRHRSEFVASPRTYVNAAAGFNQLLPAGTTLRINGIDMKLERR